jgi:hypothetical protein
MRKLALAMLLLLLFCSIADAKIIGNFSTDAIGLKTVSLDEARVKEDNSSSSINASSNISQPVTKIESIDSPDILSESVSKGNALFARSIVDGMYADFENSEVTKKYGSMRGAITTVLTFVPNPYNDPIIKNLYSDYNNLAIYFVILFILGEWFNRRMAQLKITSSVFGHKDLSHSKFIGGACMCMLALSANIIFMFALQIIQALSQFAVMPSIDAIAPSPDNLLLYIMMALCDLLVFLFFAIRYYVIYIIAVLCSLIAVMLVPDVTRGFALDAIEKIIRLLIMQPAALFASVIGIYASKGVPAPLESFGYIGLTIVVICVCWYCLFGNFTLLKQAVTYAVRKGVVKV